MTDLLAVVGIAVGLALIAVVALERGPIEHALGAWAPHIMAGLGVVAGVGSKLLRISGAPARIGGSMSFSDTIKPLLGAALKAVGAELKANAPAIAGAMSGPEQTAIAFVANELKAALPKNGILAKAEGSIVDNAVNKAAADIVAQLGGANALLVQKIADEADALGTALGA